MRFCHISPFVRFARYLKIEEGSFLSWIPCDHRLFYVINGIGKLEIGNKIVEVPKGGVILIHSGIEYKLIGQKAEYIAFNFDYTKNNMDLTQPIPMESPQKTEKINILETLTFEDAPELNSYLVLKNCRSIGDTLSQIMNIYSASLPYHAVQEGALLASALVEILRKSRNRNVSSVGLDLSQIIEFIQKNYHLPIDNKSIAEAFNFHPNYISSEFKRCTGKPLHSYILDYRITKAIELLDSGQSDLKVISSSIGFSDYNYFSRYFKKTVGVSPKKYIQTI